MISLMLILKTTVHMQTNEISQVTLPLDLLPSSAVHGYNTRLSTQLHSKLSRIANATIGVSCLWADNYGTLHYIL